MSPRAEPISAWCEKLRQRGVDEVVLLGKGPSLDEYKSRQVETRYVLAINEAAFAFPCDGVIYADTVFNSVEFPDGMDIIRPSDMGSTHGGRGYLYRVNGDFGQPLGAEEIRTYGPGTAARAFALIGKARIPRITCWGIDAFALMRFAECVKPHLATDHFGKNYAKIAMSIVAALKRETFDRVTFAPGSAHSVDCSMERGYARLSP